MTGAIGFAALAGVLSTLSPCVLPLVPLALGAAASEHKLGPAALAAGLTLSYTIIGLFVATVGFAIGLDTGMFRAVAAVLLIGIGAILMASQLQERFAIAAGPIGNWTEQRFGSFSTAGLTGQFGVGVLLGAVWSPCVGPTLGAASVMAARRENLGEVALTMLAFGLGAALPLLILGLLSRETMMLWRDRLTSTGKSVKQLLGGVLVGVGVLILSGLDKRAESWLVEASPQWLTDLTTRF